MKDPNGPPKFKRAQFFREIVKSCLNVVIPDEGEPLEKYDNPGEKRKREKPLIRPPGALPLGEFEKTCNQCGDCLPACPFQVIKKGDNGPFLLPQENPCRFCLDLPCIASCKPGALVMPEKPETLKIARVMVNPFLCLNSNGNFCSLCREKCPQNPGALELINQKIPKILTGCNGCGICAHYCPAPQNPFLVLPLNSEQNQK